MSRSLLRLFFALVAFALAGISARGAEGLAIETPERSEPVDFEREILPILRANCLACHGDNNGEGGLSLESPAAILKGGGSGSTVVPGDAEASRAFLAAAHREESFMPPADNDVGARALTPRQLGLLKLWIDQGAKGEVSAKRIVAWRSPPADYQPIFAVAVTADGQYAACGRGNQIHVYHLPTGKLAAKLVDPALAEGGSGDAPIAHRDAVRSLAFDPSGTLLASGGFREVKLWRRPRVVRFVVKFPAVAEGTDQSIDSVTAICLSPDGRFVVTGDATGRIESWPIEGPATSRFTIETDAGPVTGLALSSDGKSLVSASSDGTLRRWRVDGATAVGEPIPTGQSIRSFVALDGGERIATAGEDGKLRVWNAAEVFYATKSTIEPAREIDAHEGAVATLVAVPGQPTQVLSGGADGRARRFDVESGERLAEYGHDAPIERLAASADGARVATVGSGKTRLWDAEQGETIEEIDVDPRHVAEVARLDAEIAFEKSAIEQAKNDVKSYEGAERRTKTTAEAVTKAEEALVKAEKTRDEKKAAADSAKDDEKKAENAAKELAEAETAVGVARTVIERAKVVAERSVQTLADENAAIAAREVRLAALETEKKSAEETLARERPTFLRATFARDGSKLLLGDDVGTIHVHDAETGAFLDRVEHGKSAMIAVSSAANGRIAFGFERDGGLVVEEDATWSLESTIGGETGDPAPISDRVLALDFRPDGRMLAIGGGVPSRQGELVLWSVDQRRVALDLSADHGDTIFSARFSPDGSRIATASADRTARVIDISTGEVVHALAGHTAHVLGVSWRGDGSRIVTCGADRTLKLWDAATGLPIRTMKGTTYQIGAYKSEVAAATFIGASEQILAASGDGTVRLHRASSENDLLTYAESSGYQYAVAASPDGSYLLSGGADGVLRQWYRGERTPKRVYPP